MSRTYKPFTGPFAPMLTEFVVQKRALGYQYIAGYWVLRKFDSFSMNYDVVDYALTKEIVEAWGQKQPNESDVYWTNRILYLQQFAAFLKGQGYSGHTAEMHKSRRSQFKAYVFTHEEMKKLLDVIDSTDYSPSSPYKHLAFPLLYRMLYGCGFRISELLNLKLSETVPMLRGISVVFMLFSVTGSIGKVVAKNPSWSRMSATFASSSEK